MSGGLWTSIIMKWYRFAVIAVVACVRDPIVSIFEIHSFFHSVSSPLLASGRNREAKTIHEICIQNVYQFHRDTILIRYASAVRVMRACVHALTQLAVIDEMNLFRRNARLVAPPFTTNCHPDSLVIEIILFLFVFYILIASLLFNLDAIVL